MSRLCKFSDCNTSLLDSVPQTRYCKNDHYRECQVCNKKFKLKGPRSETANCSNLCRKQVVAKKVSITNSSKSKQEKQQIQIKKEQTLIKNYGSLEQAKKTRALRHKETYHRKPRQAKEDRALKISKSHLARTKKQVQTTNCLRKQTLIKNYGSLEQAYRQKGKAISKGLAAMNIDQKNDMNKKRSSSHLLKRGEARARITARRQLTCLERYGATNHLASLEYIKILKNKEIYFSETRVSSWAEEFIAVNGRKPRSLDLAELFGTKTGSIKIKARLKNKSLFNEDANLSYYEAKFQSSLELYDITNFDREAHIYGNKQRADFYFPLIRLAIEINPFPHHNCFWAPRGHVPKPKLYHYNKTFLAKQQNIELIHLYDWDLNNETKLNDLLSYIKQKLTNNLPPILPLQSKEPKLHWYKPKTDSHMIDKNFNKNTMIKLGYLGIYDDGTNSKLRYSELR